MQISRLFKNSGQESFWGHRVSGSFGFFFAAVMTTSVLEAQPWMDTSLRPDQRAALLTAAMTLDEKIALVHGWPGPYVGDGTNSARLGIPALHLSDGPAGLADGIQGVTALPAPILLAASWDRALARQYGTLIGQEARGKGVHVSLGPMINLVRTPMGGRNFETFGEDPYLSSAIAAEHIRGIQSQGVIANAKHFVCNDQEAFRGNENSHVDERTLQEIYYPPFLGAVRAGVGSICTAYNAINGTWSSESVLLNSIVRGKWGFDGFFECDWGGNFSMEGAALNGLDMEMPAGVRFGDPLMSAVQAGTIPGSQLDAMVRNILTSLFRFQIFDNPPTGDITTVVTTPGHAQFAHDAALQGMVLLKNSNSILPLNPGSVHSVAVSGSVAYSNPIWVGNGSASVYLPYYDYPLTGISNRAAPTISVTYAQGDNGGSIAQAVQNAQQADVAIVCVGEVTGEGSDRTNSLGQLGFSLPSDQDALINAVAAANPQTIVVMYDGAGTLMPWLNQVAAVLLAWFPGQENGRTVASILFGDTNPSGKLPVTFPAAANQIPASAPYQYPGTNSAPAPYTNMEVFYSEGLLTGYRWYDANNAVPLFPFGYGLSYTTFGYANLSISPVSSSGQVNIQCDIKNTGSRDGAEIAQLYLGFPAAAAEPPKQLKSFQKVLLPAGSTSRVSFNLDWEDLAYWDTNSHNWVIPQGTFQVMVGTSSRDIRLTGSFNISSSIPASGLANLALFKSITTSSSLSANNAGTFANDGDPGTYWASLSGTPQWISVDLGTTADLSRVRLRWDTNYARSYQIQLSDDQNNWSTVYNTTSGAGGTEDVLVTGSGRYARIFATQSGTASGFSLQEFEVYRLAEQPAGPANNTDVVWVEDRLPAGAVPGAEGGDSWNWVSNNPAPFSGTLANQSSVAAGMHQHFFTGATDALAVHSNDTLFAYVYLDPINTPSEIMLQWYSDSWEHRAFWGANSIAFGVIDTASRRNMGSLPALGQWAKLTVAASQVGLEGSTVTGMAFTQFDGRATWDYVGLQSPSPLRISGITLSANGAALSWLSSSGSVYRVSAKAQLTDATWTDVSGEILATDSTTSWLDPGFPGIKQRFYLVSKVR